MCYLTFYNQYNLLINVNYAVYYAIDLKGLPLIHSYDSIQELNRNIEKHERGHDLVISVSSIDSLFM